MRLCTVVVTIIHATTAGDPVHVHSQPFLSRVEHSHGEAEQFVLLLRLLQGVFFLEIDSRPV